MNTDSLYIIVDLKSSSKPAERTYESFLARSDSDAIRQCVFMIPRVNNYYQFAEDFELMRVSSVDDVVRCRSGEIVSIALFSEIKANYMKLIESFQNRVAADEEGE